MSQKSASKPERYAGLFEIRFHIGELYFLVPFLYCAEYGPDEKVCLVFTREDVYRQFRRDRVLTRAIDEIGAVVVRCFSDHLPEDGEGDNPEIREQVRQFKRRITRLLERTDYLFVQIGGGYIDRLMRGRGMMHPIIVRFPHTSGPALYNVNRSQKQDLRTRAKKGETMLVWDRRTEAHYKRTGFETVIPIGYHCTTPKWLDFLETIRDDRPRFALIFSYYPRDDVLPLRKWRMLHRDTYQAIRDVFPDIPIVVKPHPNQDARQLRSFMNTHQWENAEISNDNPMLLSKGSAFSVSFLTGGIFNTMLMDIPSINFFNARKEYAAHHGALKQNYAAFGAADVGNRVELTAALKEIEAGRLKMTFGTERNKLRRIESFRALTAKIRKTQGS